MKLRRVFFVGLALVSAFLLAFPLRGVIRDRIILPVAKFLWILQGYYGSLPQVISWVLTVLAAAVLAALSLRLPNLDGWRRSKKETPVRGPVEEMSFWLQRRRSGAYPRWYVARLLADLGVSLLGRKSQEQRDRQLAGPGWNPPAGVKNYLETALKSNYTEFQRRSRLGERPSTAFDEDLDPVLDYLESILESENDQHS